MTSLISASDNLISLSDDPLCPHNSLELLGCALQILEDDSSKIEGGMRVFGPAELVAGLCHTDEHNPFPVWQNGCVSPCFNQLILGALPHAAMAIFCAFYLSAQR